MHDARRLRHGTLQELPMSVAARMGVALAESLEAAMAGHDKWSFLARYRSRLLLAHAQQGTDRVAEVKRRLHMWEQGDFEGLIRHVCGQQILEDDQRESIQLQPADEEERRGKRAKQQAAAGAKSKAVKSLVGGIAAADARQRA